MRTRDEAIKEIFERHGPDAVYVASTGYISRAVHALYPDSKSIFYMQGSMGLAPAIGLGMARVSDKEIVVISGDASLLMHLGITHTIRDCDLPNLSVYVLDNGCHESVGGFSSSPLQTSYPGINNIMQVQTPSGKPPRVLWLCEENSKNIKEVL